MASKQARNTIEQLVRSGAITGDKAERWLARLSEETMVKETVQRAEGGDIEAMRQLGAWNSLGAHGLAKDHAAAHRWDTKAADLDEPRALWRVAFNHLHRGKHDAGRGAHVPGSGIGVEESCS
jgi:TPR repeat protein